MYFHSQPAVDYIVCTIQHRDHAAGLITITERRHFCASNKSQGRVIRWSIYHSDPINRYPRGEVGYYPRGIISVSQELSHPTVTHLPIRIASLAVRIAIRQVQDQPRLDASPANGSHRTGFHISSIRNYFSILPPLLSAVLRFTPDWEN